LAVGNLYGALGVEVKDISCEAAFTVPAVAKTWPMRSRSRCAVWL
jgi:hypothetical protein